MLVEKKPRAKAVRKPKTPKVLVDMEPVSDEELKRCGLSVGTTIPITSDPKSYFNLRLSSSPTGCGVRLLSGNTYIPNVKFDEMHPLSDLRSKLLKHMKDYACGAIFACLGDAHLNASADRKKYEEPLLELGFKKVIDYPNPQHGKTYRQHLYILTE